MENNTSSEKIDSQRNYNLDLIRAICIPLVLTWHLKPFDVSIPNLTKFSANIIFKEALIAMYFQVTLVAVPVFLIISQYLYFQKLEKYGYSYFFRRIQVLLSISIFWISMQFIFYYFIAPLISADVPPTTFPSGILGWLQLFMMGGPGGSAFYFLTALMTLTVFSTLFMIISKYKWLKIFIGLFIILSSLAYFQIQALYGGIITYWRIENFIIYTPIAYFIHAYGDKLRFTAKSVLWLVYFLLCLQDVLSRHTGLQFNLYGRASIAFGATALVCSLINKKKTRESKLVNLLSTYSLGIFALHLYIHYFVIRYLTPLFIKYGVQNKIPLWEFRINFRLLCMGFTTVVLTLFCVYIAGKSPLKRFVK